MAAQSWLLDKVAGIACLSGRAESRRLAREQKIGGCSAIADIRD